MKAVGSFNSIYEVKSNNRNNGYNWFSPDTLRWFNGKVYDVLYGGCVFVSSEKDIPFRGSVPQREYSVRVAMDNGTIERYGVYNTKRQADREAQWLAKALANGTIEWCNTDYTFKESTLLPLASEQ